MFAIFQLKRTPETIRLRFERYKALERQGIEPDLQHYDLVYIEYNSEFNDQKQYLESIYAKFNLELPNDFCGHSLSVSDIVALNINQKSLIIMSILLGSRIYRLLVLKSKMADNKAKLKKIT